MAAKRYQISALLEQEMSFSSIANTAKYHRISVNRELKRYKSTK
ncbi:helix-turn-helix domain-containing protein [Marinomonas balearica]|nr:helix-turn-helix domain-containing protein [Marinomonas balearica]